jgi:hypothetical protein
MPTTNQVMFTALPSGVVSATSTGTEVSLSVYVTPQLLAAASITTAPGFSNWPAVAAGLTFQATLTSTATSKSVTATCSLDTRNGYATGRFDSTLWTAIFGPPPGKTSSAIGVNTFAVPNYTASGTLSFAAAPVSSVVKSAYSSVASLTAKPSITAAGTDTLSTTTANVAGVLNVPAAAGSGTLANAGQVVLGSVQKGITATAASLSSTALATLQSTGQVAKTPEAEFARVAAYHNRKNFRALQPTGTAGQTTAVSLDFHQIVGHLADHPFMLRRLGLLIDLTFVIPPGSGIDGAANLVVQPEVAISGLTTTAPTTACIVHEYGSTSAVAFRPLYGDVDNNGNVLNPLIDTNGLLWADNASVLTMDTLDVDHAAINVANYAEQASSDLAGTGTGGSLQVTLPALKTTGFALHHNNREGLVGMRLAQNSLWSSGSTFFAEDFFRGMRVDVRTVTGTPGTAGVASAWMSLCLRQSTFAFTNGHAAVVLSDEGYVKSSGMSAASTASTTDVIYNVHETLLNWDGWSLVAARPGLSVGAATASTSGGIAPDGPVVPVPTNTGAGVNLPFTNTIVPMPGKLPKLRFGTTYEFRVRAVDIAGNDMMLSAATDNTLVHASPATTFQRYEPVAPPVLQLRKAVCEGESIEYMVVRSDPWGPGMASTSTWASANSAAPNGTAMANVGMNPYFPTCERHVSPPKTSVQMAEWHGALDNALAKVTAANYVQSAWAIVSKEDGTYYDAMVTDTSTGQYRTVAQAPAAAPSVGRQIITPAASQVLLAQAVAAGTPTFTGTQDITRGDALVNGQYVILDTTQVILPYLPDANASGVSFQGLPVAAGAPTTRTWGARVANPSGGVWPELSPWRLVLAGGPANSEATVSGLGAQSVAGTAVTVTLPPATQLSFTYSSMIGTPTAHAFCPADAADQTNAANGLLPLLSPQRKLTMVHAVQHPMPPGLVTGDIVPQDRNPGETAQTIVATYRFDGNSSARLDFTASWEEYVDQAGAANPSVPLPHSGIIDTITPNPGDSVVNTKTVRQLFGDTKRRDITYSTVATTRFREFFPSSITSIPANITNKTSLPTIITCKSSARPPVPKVLYAVPSFLFNPLGGAAAPASGTTSTSTRSGGIVRVYVDRPWYATGQGECLGLVLAPNPSGTVQSSLTTTYPNLVSQWGTDPIWYKGGLNALDRTHVNLATSIQICPGVALAEGVGTVDVACFAPNFNQARGLWYFDIGLNTDQAYFPFLRLALCRFQFESISDPSSRIAGALMQASPVVTTEFVQLSATRNASVTNAGSGNYTVSVSGITAANQSAVGSTALLAQSGHAVTAEFQEATTANPDDIDWSTIGYVNTLTASSLSGNTVTYTGSIAFPSYDATGGAKHRILFKEYELYPTDPQAGIEQGVGIVQLGGTTTSYTQRIVYADSILIPS